jgi:hypothetical protein
MASLMQEQGCIGQEGHPRYLETRAPVMLVGHVLTAETVACARVS